MEPMPYRRSCVKIVDESGKERIYRWYDEHQQSAKWHGKNGKRTCEHCGRAIETWEFFYWRLYGLCDGCYAKGESGWVDDYVIEADNPRRLGRRVTTVAKQGGRDDSNETLKSYRRRCEGWDNSKKGKQ